MCTCLGRHMYMFVYIYIDAQAHTQCKLRNQSSNLEKKNYSQIARWPKHSVF